MSHLAQLANNYVYCIKRTNTLIYDIYGFNLNNSATKCRIKYKIVINLQLYEDKKEMDDIKVLRLQHNCVIFAIQIKQWTKTIICIFRFEDKCIISKHLFKTQFNSNQVINCNLVSNILLFEIEETSNKRYYALYGIQNEVKIGVRYIRTWPKEIIKPLIVILPSIIHPLYALGSCLKNNNNNNNKNDSSNIIWDLSLFIPHSYLRHLMCITPHSISLVQANYMDWFWWISVQKPSTKQCKILLIKNQKIMTRIQFPSNDGNITPLSLISINNFDTLLFITQKQQNCDENEEDEEDEEDDDIDMENKNKYKSFLECHIIKRDSLHQKKMLIGKQYELWFNNNNDNDDMNDNNDSIYKCVHRHKFNNMYNSYNFDLKNMMLLTYKLKHDTLKIINTEWIQCNFQCLDIKKFILYKIPQFFENPLNSLKISHLKQLQRIFKFQYKYLSQFNNELYDIQLPLKNDELIHFEWNNWNNKNFQNLIIKLPTISNKNNNSTKGIILSCPYIRFSVFSINFKMENPTKFMQSMVIGDFMSFKRDFKAQSLMLHTFEPNIGDLEHLSVLQLSLQQIITIKCNTQNMDFYDGLQQNEINHYLNKMRDNNKYHVLYKYLNKFVECFDVELQENVTRNENDFYQVLKSRLFPKYYIPLIPLS